MNIILLFLAKTLDKHGTTPVHITYPLLDAIMIPNRPLSRHIIYLKNECTEEYQFELCSKYDREYGFDVILG